MGVSVDVVAPRYWPADVAWRDGAVAVHPSYRRGDPRAPRSIVRSIESLDARTVHVQHELFAFGGLRSAFALPRALRGLRASRRKVVTTIHGVIPLERITAEFCRANRIPAPAPIVRTVWRHLLRQVALASDAVHVHEFELADLLRKQYGVHDRPIHVIPIGSGPHAKGPERARARGFIRVPADAEVVLFFGYMSTYKGVAEFLEAMASALPQRPRLHVVLAGDVPARLKGWLDLPAMIARCGEHRDRIHALGFIPTEDVEMVFAAADALVLPYTIVMAASGAMSHAIAHGVPVLMSDRFKSAYPTAPGLFQPDASSIARAVCDFFERPALRAQSMEFFRALGTGRSWNSVAEKIASLYEAL